MTQLERARQYAAIFINVGDRWADYAPLDAKVTRGNGVVRFGDEVQMQREPGNRWAIYYDGQCERYGLAASDSDA
jgi:hypothetical protein